MKKLFGAFIISLLAFISCNNQTSNTETSTANDTVVTSPPTTNVADTTTAKQKEDFVLSPSDNSVTQTESKIEPTQTLSEILKKLDKSPQTFSVPANKDTTIICSEGTSINFKSNSFVSEVTGKEITGRIKISVKEYYKLSEMLFATLSTTSGKDILETGGMINITASSNNKNCILKKENTIGVGFPYKQKKENMQLFKGDWTNNKVNWTLNKSQSVSSSINSQSVFTIVENMPVFSGGETALKKYVEQKCQYPFSALDKKVEGTVYVSFVVDAYGEISGVGILKGANPSLDKVAYWIVSNMPSWEPGRQNGSPVSVQYNLPIKFSLKGTPVTPELIEKSKQFEKEIANVKVVYGNAMTTNDENFKKKFEEKENDSTLATTKLGVINSYLFTSSQLGWINCDRFFKNNTPRIDYVVDAGQSTDTRVTLVFHSLKAILNGGQYNNRYKFGNIPTGEKVTVVAMKRVDNRTLLAIKESTTATRGETNLAYEPVTMEKLKADMKKLEVLD